MAHLAQIRLEAYMTTNIAILSQRSLYFFYKKRFFYQKFLTKILT